MRWMLVLLGVAIFVAMAVLLLGRGGGDTSDADGLAARGRAAYDPGPLREEHASGEDAANEAVDRSGGETAAGLAVDGATSTTTSMQEAATLDPGGEREGREPRRPPTLAGAASASEPRARGAGDERPMAEPTEGSIVQVRVVSEGDDEPLPGALVVLVDAAGQRHEQRADAKGVASFIDLPPGDSEADALIEGWVSRWLLPLSVPAAGKLESDLRMQASVPLHGFVRTVRDEAPVVGARVTAIAGGTVHENRGRSSSSRGVYEVVETDATGAFRFASLPKDEVCTLAVLAGGYRYADLGVVPRADAKEPAVIRLEPGGRVRGRVTDPAGRPVVGAEVFAFLESQPHLARNPRQGRLGREPKRVSLPAVSGDDGHFEVVGLALDEPYGATAYAKGYLRAENVNGIVVTAAAPEVTIDLEVRLAARVRVRVLDPEGQPVAGGQVVAVQRGRFSRRLTAGADGTALIEGIPPGPLRVRVQGEGFFPLGSTVEVGSGDVLELELKLEPLPPGVEVSGVAVDEGGTPIAGLPIVGTSLEIRHTVRTTTDQDGHFVLSNLQAGKTAIRANQLGVKPSTLEIEAPAEDVRLVVTRFTRVRGRVELAPGTAKPDIIYVSTQTLADGMGGGGSNVPFRDGTFEAFVKPDVLVRLRVHADTFAPWTREVRVPEGETLDLGTVRVEAGIAVAGVVLDPDGQPVAGVVLEVELGIVAPRTATTDADGRFRLEHLPVGMFSVELLAEGYPEQTQEVEATMSIQDVRLMLTRGE